MRRPADREYSHERLGSRFRDAISEYDTQCRLETLVGDFLHTEPLAGQRVLDVGAGYGQFSARLQQQGAIVTASDIGPSLLAQVRQNVGCDCVVADALGLVEVFGESKFDGVISSECIEHTPDPASALRQMARVLRPGGWLSVSTPNKVWYPAVKIATLAGLRPYDGYENFSTFGGLRTTLEAEGLTIVHERGLHLFPFQLGLHGPSRWCDERFQFARYLMINLCVFARKPGGPLRPQ